MTLAYHCFDCLLESGKDTGIEYTNQKQVDKHVKDTGHTWFSAILERLNAGEKWELEA